jgi:glucoamylase
MRRQYSLSAAALPRSISAVHLVKDRQAFGQIIRPAKGSVLASPVIASYDPDPDYFFHWLRDSALAMDAVRLLIVDGTLTAAEGIAHFKDFIAFNARLEGLDGAAFLAEAGDFRQKVDPAFLQYVRPDDDLRRIKGERLLGEPRFNPDGTLDILKWSRPQHDGAALRALSLMRFQKLDAIDDKETSARIDALIRRDLDFAYRHWRDPSFDIWEEELGWHYYTQLVQRAALADGAEWMEGAGEFDRAKALREAAREAAQSLDAYWSPLEGFYRSRLGDPAETSQKDLDIAVALAVIHADRKEGAHSPLDPKALATLVRLEDLFAAAYPINQGADDDLAPALGRYAGDRYYSGGAYYFSTLGAAQFYYRLAEAARRAPIPIAPENRDIVERLGAAFLTDGAQAQDPQARLHGALLRRGDQFMATIRAYAPASGELAEQFDQATGAPASAKSLTWSHAAFITAFASRGAALGSPPLGATK